MEKRKLWCMFLNLTKMYFMSICSHSNRCDVINNPGADDIFHVFSKSLNNGWFLHDFLPSGCLWISFLCWKTLENTLARHFFGCHLALQSPKIVILGVYYFLPFCCLRISYFNCKTLENLLVRQNKGSVKSVSIIKGSIIGK